MVRVKGYSLSKEHKQKISVSHSARGETHWTKQSDVKKRISDGMKKAYAEGRRSFSLTEGHKIKIGLANSGKKRSIELRERIGQTKLTSNTTPRGEKHPHWRPDSRTNLCRSAKLCDDYTCQMCGLRDVEIIEVDHINSISLCPDAAFTLENLQCLCPNCHRRKTIRDRKLIAEYKRQIKLAESECCY